MEKVNLDKKIIAFFLVILVVSCLSFMPGRKARIKEKREVIKTYPFSSPDPIPIFAKSTIWGRGARLYPYFFFDKFNTKGENKEWKVVRMENPYLKVSVLPQAGGKVWGALEKSTKKEFIYTNHVMKFRQIALRGPWTSGGVEFNFGIVGHSPSTASPVDYMLRKNRDGSVSCVVGTTDLPSRTRWSVTITLPPDKAYFETKALWYNPTPLNQSYYVWITGAIHTGDDLQYIFPGRYQIGHSYSKPLRPWPVDSEGRNLSWYRNNDFGSSKSYFIVGEYENFFGGYWHNSEFGFGHWARYDDIPGKKIWIWALSREGAIWEDLLTDADGQYSEPQAGRLFNQSDHEFFLPYSADSWREIWFPYKKIGPMVNASPWGVLNVTHARDSIKIGIFPLQRINDELVLKVDGKEIYREHLKLKPAEVYEKRIPFSLKSNYFYLDLGGKIQYTSDPKANDLQRPILFRTYKENSAEGLFLAASRLEKERDYAGALEKYLACLEKEPLHTRALCRVGEIYFRRAEYEKALFYARNALEISMYDPEANYLYGIISRRLGNLIDALETLGWAARSMKYRSSAYCQMAEIYLVEKNYSLALEYARRSLKFNTHNINASQVMAVAFRKMNKHKKAYQVLKNLLEIEPLNHLARYELYLLKPGQKNLKHFQSMIRNEFPEETMIEMALFYIKTGLLSEAKNLLEFVSHYPTACYWLAFLLRDEFSEQSKTYLGKAASLSPRFVFPFREESVEVFEWAIKTSPADWKAKYYLGLLLWSKGRVEEGRALLEKCGYPDFAPLYLARAQFYKKSDPNQALEEMKRALDAERDNWKTWHMLINFYLEQGRKEEAMSSAKEAALLFPDDVTIKVDLIRAHMANRNFEEAADLLDKIVALPSEGATALHRLFVRSHLELAFKHIKSGNLSKAISHLEKSKSFPENLGRGRPYEPDLRMQDYLSALCASKLGNKDKAEELMKSVRDYTLRKGKEKGRGLYFGALALEYFGDFRKAEKLHQEAELPSQAVLEIIKLLKEKLP